MSYKFDHRQLADEMEIYFIDEHIGAGLPVWLPNGVAIRDELERFMRELEALEGYQRVVSPHVAKSDLFAMSGHLRLFGGNMFPPMHWPDGHEEYYLKPMNCPLHHKVFASSLRSYRQLPLRVAEYGCVYRYENSGSLKGLSRVRGLCQNDAHIYVAPQDPWKKSCVSLTFMNVVTLLLGSRATAIDCLNTIRPANRISTGRRNHGFNAKTS